MSKQHSKYLWSINCEGFVFYETEGLRFKQKTIPAGTIEQLHLKEKSHHVFYVSKGEAICYIKKKILAVKENKSIHVKPMQEYFVENKSISDLEFFIISPPTYD